MINSAHQPLTSQILDHIPKKQRLTKFLIISKPMRGIEIWTTALQFTPAPILRTTRQFKEPASPLLPSPTVRLLLLTVETTCARLRSMARWSTLTLPLSRCTVSWEDRGSNNIVRKWVLLSTQCVVQSYQVQHGHILFPINFNRYNPLNCWFGYDWVLLWSCTL